MAINRYTVAAAIFCLLTGCASTENYATAVNSWQGVQTAQLYDSWGYPDTIQKLPNGNKVLVYQHEEKIKTPTTVTQTGPFDQSSHQSMTAIIAGGDTQEYHCTTWFEVNSVLTIVNTNFRGNNCLGNSDFIKTHGFDN